MYHEAQTQGQRAAADVMVARPPGAARSARASRTSPQAAAGFVSRPAQSTRDAPDLVLDVHLQVRVSASGSPRLGAVQAGETDLGQDLVAALLSGTLHCLTDPETAAPVSLRSRTGTFRREGEYWTIAYGDCSFLLKDMKGLRHLARLLAHPDRELHALDLVRLEEGTTPALSERGEDPQAPGGGLGDAGELLDSQAKRAYRQRLVALRDELDAADDPELRARLSAEMDMLAHQLASAMGLGGRDVKAASAAERARLNVTNRIRAAITKIAAHDPALSRHLDAAVRTGAFCSYRPEPTACIAWATCRLTG